ncbi:gluconate 2-dehydrogenase subunit 3 family protein [Bacillus pinisoli]|uniref:gluconate 2-dehydrogenase subunit 3 family protein n=1 Tax=Bacillus pinisoli TaxID=2901866 RepID=UPI001FF20887|nr:gluconate 2-dehydrogenase subunit 3 family protein [Bacillus pinisoli]
MVHPKRTYYPDYDVLSEWDEWDPTTQAVLKERLSRNETHLFNEDEKDVLLSLIPILFPSHLGDVSIDVLANFDQRCQRMNGYAKGTSVKKVDVIKTGLTSLMSQIFDQYQEPFSCLSEEIQKEFVQDLKSNVGYKNCWQSVSPLLFFKTVTEEILPIVYSDPSLWSKIGYGGPSYPRGYYAFGPNQFDKWEAKIHE